MAPKIPDKYSPCAKCASAAPTITVDRDHYDVIPELKTPDELTKYQRSSTQEQHVIGDENVLAHYQFKDEVQCSMPGRHPHRHGYVVATPCGLTLNLGIDCSEDLIENFDRVRRLVSNSREYNEFVEVTGRHVQQLRQRLQALSARQERLFKARSVINASEPMFASSMQQRLKERASRRREEIPSGIELWDYAKKEIKPRITDLRALEVEVAAADEKGTNFQRRRELRKLVDAIEREADELEAWCRAASVFVTPAGMASAVAIHDSDWVTHKRSAFSAEAGTERTETVETFERKRECYRVTPEGLMNVDTGQVVGVDWAN